jgi:hypothetical protein
MASFLKLQNLATLGDFSPRKSFVDVVRPFFPHKKW